ncbi:MAG: three-Cys-motif partner protein TcmP [Terracidiphilus sp.]|nr:three-Cys-motif partner protein TcmP [Terracidiphilus sp.]
MTEVIAYLITVYAPNVAPNVGAARLLHKPMPSKLKLDEVGYWSEIKLEILEKYAKPYTKILRARHMRPIYIDGFAGAGRHAAKGSNRLIDGSPVRALNVDPPFEAFHLVDIDGARTDELNRLSSGKPNVFVHLGDCNQVLRNEVFPEIDYAKYMRALCILDPYGLHLDWETIQAAGQSDVIEIFLNFPVMDMNMNVLWHNSDRVADTQKERMTRFWGDDSWKRAAYPTTQGLFGPMQEKASNQDVADAFRERLKKVAGFKYVPKPIAMRNTKGAIVYYLFFAAHQKTAGKIVEEILARYEHHGEVPHG